MNVDDAGCVSKTKLPSDALYKYSFAFAPCDLLAIRTICLQVSLEMCVLFF